MATRLNQYNFDRPSKIATSERRQYPWDVWFDGTIWMLEWGVDFDNHPLMMERVIRSRATTKRHKLALRHEGRKGDAFGFIILQAQDVTPAVAPAPVRSKRPVRHVA